MGTKVPEIPFVLDPAKTYHVVTNVWQSPEAECCNSGEYIGTLEDDIDGASLIWWLESGYECSYWTLFAIPGVFFVEQIHSVVEV